MNRSFLIILAILAIFSLILHAIYVFGRLGVRDIPNERSLHTEITKKSGGMIFIPYFLLLFFLWGFLSQFGYLHSFPFPNENFTFKLLIFGTIFFCLLGFACHFLRRCLTQSTEQHVTIGLEHDVPVRSAIWRCGTMSRHTRLRVDKHQVVRGRRLVRSSLSDRVRVRVPFH